MESHQTISRRAFLRAAVIGSSGVVVAACTPPPVEEAQVEEIQTLRIAWGNAPATLDPLSASADVEIAFLAAVYDYLVDTTENNEVLPRLATSWEVSNDGLMYTFTLAEAAFHSGDMLRAQDVIWSFDRLRDLDTASGNLLANVEGISAPNEQTVRFTLNRPDPDFLFTIADNRAIILQQGAEDIGTVFNGTGPFKVQAYVPNDRASFEHNSEYFAGTPAVDLEFVYFNDNVTAANALRSGSVHGVVRLDNATFLSLPNQEYQKIEVKSSGHDLIRLRQDRGPGSDSNVVLAFKHATNREAIFDRVQLGFGDIGNDTPIGPVYEDIYAQDIQPPAYNPQRARELLAEAGYQDGLELTLHVPDSGDRVALAETLAAQWEEAGILVELNIQDESRYYADNVWLEVDLGITPWGARPTPQFYLTQAYQTDAIWNETKISDARLDELIKAASSTFDEQERIAAYQEIQEIINEKGSVIIPYFFATLGVFARNVSGVSLHSFSGRTNFATAQLSE